MPPGKIYRARARIVDLDPIRSRAILIQDRSCIVGHELGNNHLRLGGAKQQAKNEKEENVRPPDRLK